jgi:hypothetical protein
VPEESFLVAAAWLSDAAPGPQGLCWQGDKGNHFNGLQSFAQGIEPVGKSLQLPRNTGNINGSLGDSKLATKE